MPPGTMTNGGTHQFLQSETGGSSLGERLAFAIYNTAVSVERRAIRRVPPEIAHRKPSSFAREGGRGVRRRPRRKRDRLYESRHQRSCFSPVTDRQPPST